MEKILLFTGAGFGVPIGLPTTFDFLNDIRKANVDIHNIFKQLLNTDINDIEKVLYVLDNIENNNIIEVLIKICNEKSITKSYDFGKLKNDVKNFNDSLKTNLFDLLENFDGNNNVKLYSNLIKQLKINRNNSISIFTSNYDLTFEHFIDNSDKLLSDLEIKDVDFGFTTKNSKSVFSSTKNYNWNSSIIEYKKLHGSIDWSLGNNNQCSKSGNSIAPANPKKMPILYPGFKGTPNEEPFKTLHFQFLDRLLSANLVIVVGFAFRDDYINNLFELALKQKQDVNFHCFNPSPIEDLPKESSISYFKNKYKNFIYHQNGIKIEENPLNYDFFPAF